MTSAEQLLLLADGGNTAVKWQLYDSGLGLFDSGYSSYASSSEQSLNDLTWKNISGVLYADVSGQLASRLGHYLNASCTITEQASTPHLLGVTNCYQEPKRLGVDRFLNAVQGYYLSQGAACVIDLGTATKVDVVNRLGVHQGGYIVPGVDMLQASLLKGTGKVRFSDGERIESGMQLGDSTASAVINGCHGMTLQWLKMVVDDFYQSAPGGHVYLTGGFAGSVSAGLMAYRPKIIRVNGLVLSALLRIAKQAQE